MKDPSSVRTSSREDMICPKCYTEGLEEHTAFADDYSSKKAKILKATRCPNTDCDLHRGFPQEVIEQQYVERSLIDKFSSFGSGDSSISIGSAILYGVLGIAFLMMVASGLGIDVAGLIGGDAGGQGQIDGYVLGPDGDAMSGVTVRLIEADAQATTSNNGSFSISNVSYGVYTVRAIPSEGSGSVGAVDQRVQIGEDGLAVGNISRAASVENGSLGLQLVSVESATQDVTLGEGNSVSYDIVSPYNWKDGLQLRVSPLENTENTGEASVRMRPSEVGIPEGELQNAEISVRGRVTSSQRSDSYRYSGGSQSVQVYGNIVPRSFTVTIPSEANTQVFSERQTVADGETVTIDVVGQDTVGEVLVTLSGGQSDDPVVTSGVYRGTNPSISIDAESAPSTATLRLTGNVSRKSVTDTGTLSGDSLTTTIEGTIAAENAEIIFTGGQPENSSIQSTTIDASGQNGDETTQYALIQNADDATYRLDLDHTIEQNSRLVTAGYSVDGSRTTISSGTDSVTINADGGETIAIFIEAKQESVPESSYTHSGQFEVQNTEVSAASIQPGESVGVRATLHNPASSARAEVIPVFRDGEKVHEERVEISAGGTKTVTFTRVQFNSEGVHNVEVSDGEPVKVYVGDTSLEYGAGSISGDLVRVGDAGEVAFDTNGDGTFDCRVSADGGTCSIGDVESGATSFAFSQRGVSNTGYELTYTSRYGASGISVDMDEDGQTDLSVPGILGDGETVSETVTLDAGTKTFNVNVENGGDVPYEISYTEAGTVSQPEVAVNGQTVISESESFKGERTYEIGELAGGENTFRFESGDGESYVAEIEWTAASSETTPELYVDGELACSKSELADGTCDVPRRLLDTGSVALSFEDGASEFEYDVDQTARAVPTRIDVRVNDETVSINREEAVTVAENGSWTARRSLNELETGSNTVSLSTSLVNGVEPSARGTVTYTYDIPQAQNPVVVVENGGEMKNVSVPESALDSEGYLVQSTTVNVPQGELVAGPTTVRIASENDGGVGVRILYVNETVPETQITQKTTESSEDDSSTEN